MSLLCAILGQSAQDICKRGKGLCFLKFVIFWLLHFFRIFNFFEMIDDTASVAESMLQLARAALPSTPPRDETEGEREVEYITTPRKIARPYRLTGMKRNMTEIQLFYDNGEDTVTVPVIPGDTMETVNARREKAARLHIEQFIRVDVLCSWSKKVISILHDERWQLARESPQQQRYFFASMQLIKTRFTCAQWREDGDVCRNCQHKNWRSICTSPRHLYHLMPLPAFRDNTRACDEDLVALDVFDRDQEPAPWLKHMPPLSIGR